MDSVTPDLKVMIEETLRERYRTTCPDVVAIFGSKILPRIQTSGEQGVTKEDIVNCCVLVPWMPLAFSWFVPQATSKISSCSGREQNLSGSNLILATGGVHEESQRLRQSPQ